MPRPKSEETKRTAAGTYQSRVDAIRRYDEKMKDQVDDIRLRVPKGWREKMKNHAAAAGYTSVNALICELIRNEIPGIDGQSGDDV